jgi:hypothetical protein
MATDYGTYSRSKAGRIIIRIESVVAFRSIKKITVTKIHIGEADPIKTRIVVDYRLRNRRARNFLRRVYSSGYS